MLIVLFTPATEAHFSEHITIQTLHQFAVTWISFPQKQTQILFARTENLWVELDSCQKSEPPWLPYQPASVAKKISKNSERIVMYHPGILWQIFKPDHISVWKQSIHPERWPLKLYCYSWERCFPSISVHNFRPALIEMY